MTEEHGEDGGDIPQWARTCGAFAGVIVVTCLTVVVAVITAVIFVWFWEQL